MSAPTPATRFAAIIEGLCDAVAEAGLRPNLLMRAFALPLLALLWRRLHRAPARFARILESARSAKILETPIPASGPTSDPTPKPTRARKFRPAQPGLPRGFAWLVATLPDAAAAGSQLRDFLAEPDIAPLLEQDPRMARLLRPICQALGVRLPETLRLARKPRPKAPPRIRIRTRMNRPPTKASLHKARMEYLRFLKTIPAEWLPGKIPRPLPTPQTA